MVHSGILLLSVLPILENLQKMSLSDGRKRVSPNSIPRALDNVGSHGRYTSTRRKRTERWTQSVAGHRGGTNC